LAPAICTCVISNDTDYVREKREREREAHKEQKSAEERRRRRERKKRENERMGGEERGESAIVPDPTGEQLVVTVVSR